MGTCFIVPSEKSDKHSKVGDIHRRFGDGIMREVSIFAATQHNIKYLTREKDFHPPRDPSRSIPESCCIAYDAKCMCCLS